MASKILRKALSKSWFTMLMKVTSLVAAIAVPMTLQSAINKQVPDVNDKCIFDVGHNSFLKTTEYMRDHVDVKKAILAIDSFLIDCLLLSFFMYWCFFNPLFSGAYCVMIFYLGRIPMINIANWPVPPPNLWEYPGVPSLFVSYATTNDMYFSGHTGLMATLLLDSVLNRRWVLSILICLGLVLTVFMLEMTHGHFTNDIIIGLVFGYLSAMIGQKLRLHAAMCYLVGSVLVFDVATQAWNWMRLIGNLLTRRREAEVPAIIPEQI